MRRTSRPYKRKDIKKQDIGLDIIEEEKSLFVKIDISDLSDYDFPKDSEIFLEAYNNLDIEHIDLGRVGSFPREKVKKKLSSFEVQQRSKIKFRLKIVNLRTWHLLGLAERLKEKKYADSLISIKTDSRINTVFKIDWDDPDNPVLLINEKLANGLDNIKPVIGESVFREILMTLLFENDLIDEDELNDHKWIVFAKKQKDIDSFMGLEFMDKKKWIDTVIDEFSRKNKIIEKLLRLQERE